MRIPPPSRRRGKLSRARPAVLSVKGSATSGNLFAVPSGGRSAARGRPSGAPPENNRLAGALGAASVADHIPGRREETFLNFFQHGMQQKQDFRLGRWVVA